jgi:hypothetical protein
MAFGTLNKAIASRSQAMETQNTEVTVHLPETTAEKALQFCSAPIEELNNEVVGLSAADRRLGSDEVAVVIRAEFNADIDRDLLARMRGLKQKGGDTTAGCYEPAGVRPPSSDEEP